MKNTLNMAEIFRGCLESKGRSLRLDQINKMWVSDWLYGRTYDYYEVCFTDVLLAAAQVLGSEIAN